MKNYLAQNVNSGKMEKPTFKDTFKETEAQRV